MFHRVVIAVGCILLLAGCQQTTPGDTPGALIAPSSLAMKAVDVPFSGGVTGQVDFSTTHCAPAFTAVITAAGPFTHMGLSTWTSRHCVAMGQVTQGDLQLTAANGDTLHVTYTGTCASAPIGQPIVCTGPAVILPGTGRFEHASGTATFRGTVTNLGMNVAIWPGSWELLDGSIRY